jgi:hypothetical protein
MILVRTLLEYRITLGWLILDPELHFLQWARDDLKSRLRVDREVRELGEEVMSDKAREAYEEAIVLVEAKLGDRSQRYPSLKERAQATGEELAYSLAYRFDSQTAAHPSAFAAEQLFEDRPEHGGVAVLSDPAKTHGYVDPYAVAAFTLLDMLEAVREGLEPHLGNDFDAAKTRLEKLRQSGSAWYPSAT